MKLIGSLSFIWLAMAIVATSGQELGTPVYDTSGQPLQRGVEYIIKVPIDSLTLINRNVSSCPFYVGLQNVTANEIPVTFSPFEEDESIVRLNKNFKVTFSGVTPCAQSTTWKVGQGESDMVNGRRLITTGDDAGYNNYFYLVLGGDFINNYRMEWCPTELCPTCRFRCGSVGSLSENGKEFVALDGSPALSLVFERV